ncbi:Aldo/keto reductase [Penicillium lagena]|uniref:Aldo/keto reductase n=1 Tax=Penicillium lagena TaxID=94218 RepID=UPI002540E27E|nr:Aldo/keto reductase [Penicillium lagena]KAJ5606066.1 Aldo/keto reductase [Penicillium lagena]
MKWQKEHKIDDFLSPVIPRNPSDPQLHHVREDNGIHPVNSPAPRRDHIDILTSVCYKQNSLGNSGLKISKIILGTMSYGSSQWQDWVLDEDKALPLIEHAYKQGINTWDTADIYSHGRSEEIIGKALKQFNIPRNRVVILTKCFFGVDDEGNFPPISASATNDGEFVNRTGLSRKHIFDAVDASVQRLGTYIDVLQIHRLDRDTPREEIMKALNDVVESGKFISMQNYHNLIAREEEREMIPYCLDSGVGLIPWSPMARGALARPWGERSSIREKTDGAIERLVRSRESEADKIIVSRVEEVALKKGLSMAQIAMAWSLSHRNMCPIVGLSSTARIDEAVKSVKVKLTDEEIRYLEEAYVPKTVAGW